MKLIKIILFLGLLTLNFELGRYIEIKKPIEHKYILFCYNGATLDRCRETNQGILVDKSGRAATEFTLFPLSQNVTVR